MKDTIDDTVRALEELGRVRRRIGWRRLQWVQIKQLLSSFVYIALGSGAIMAVFLLLG